MTNNLNRPRPPHWTDGHLFPFIEDCWSNSVATFANKTIACQKLTAIDELFEDVHRDFKPENIRQLVPAFLFMRSFTAFRATTMVSLCLPTEGYALARLCLESAGYALLIEPRLDLAET